MPKQLYPPLSLPPQADGSLQCSLVAFHPGDGERLVFSWSAVTARGPGISRRGSAPPSMRTFWNEQDPFGTTDDPEQMRWWSNYVDDDGLKMEQLLGLPPGRVGAFATQPRFKHLFGPDNTLCGPPPGPDLRRLYAERSDKALRSRAVHTWCVADRHPGKTLVGQVGCGDTTMNLWHVAFACDPGGVPTFLLLDNEPIYEREYPCLVGWVSNQESRGASGPRVSFEEAMKFNPGTSGFGVWIDGRECSSDIEFAVAGKPLISSTGQIIPLNQVTHFFSDLRHLFSLPRLTPSSGIGGSVVMFGREIASDLWLGEKQLLDDVNLQRAACKGPVLLDRLYGGLSVTASYLDTILLAHHYQRRGGTVEWQPGQFQIDRSGTGFEVYFKEARYPWNILAVGSYFDGERKGQSVVLSFACGGQSGRSHFTLSEAVRRLREEADKNGIHLKGAVLLDEGGDVFQKVDHEDGRGLRPTLLDPLRPGDVFACQRRFVRCCFFVVKG